jgi:hypothetical protein
LISQRELVFGADLAVRHRRPERNGSCGCEDCPRYLQKSAEDPGYLEATAKLDQEAAYMSTDDYRRYVAAQLIEQKS